MMQDFELVVAHYKEDLRWLRNIPPQIRVTVYDKSEDDTDAESTSALRNTWHLDNVGREAHTYLHHICSRYETLAPLTVFCQSKPFDHAFDFRKTLRELAAGRIAIKDFLWLGHMADTDSPCGVLFRNWSKNETGEGLDLEGFHRALFDCEGPRDYAFFGGAQFVATRDCIHRRSLGWYQNALRIAVDFPNAAHCFERTWDRIFGEEESTLARMNGERTKYFKPIRRLVDEAEV
jgi:hypothetical protein